MEPTIAITGAYTGLGLALYENLSLKYTVIKTQARLESISQLIDEIQPCNILINNANIYGNHHQLEVLDRVYRLWQQRDNLIINIGSRAAVPNISLNHMHSTYKAAINHYSSNVSYQDPHKVCRVTTINPGLMDRGCDWSLDYAEVVDTVLWVLSLPNTVEVNRIDLQRNIPYPCVEERKRDL
jgi:NADP-dependent 3-hydroxy acid dehydrogenase YdfG